MNEIALDEAVRDPDGAVPAVLLVDTFERSAPPGRVIGSWATSGARRSGIDRAGTMSIDHGQLRIGWFEHAGWGRAALAYGPFDEPDGLVLSVRALNGLTTSQTDPRPEGRRAMLRRWRATAPRISVRQPSHRESFAVGWFPTAVPRPPVTPVAAVVHRAGDDAAGELWFVVGDRRVRVASDLQNVPAQYVVALGDGVASLFAWSYRGAHGFAARDDVRPLAQLPLAAGAPDELFACVHQVVLGEVRYRVDTRIDEVRVLRATDAPADVAARLVADAPWDPAVGQVAVHDAFDGDEGDLHGTEASGDARWARVLGVGGIDRTGRGDARVRASRAQPNPGRTLYCVPWRDPAGVEVSAVITPPGEARGQGHRGRSGLVIWQDADNHLVLNHFLDDGSVGVSISAFLRSGGREQMCEWDAVWSNVGRRVTWGRPFRLSVACDGAQFLCRVDGEPVLYRALTDYRADVSPLTIRGVGIGANWEWGDDTGTTFAGFTARRLHPGRGIDDGRPSASPAERPIR